MQIHSGLRILRPTGDGSPGTEGSQGHRGREGVQDTNLQSQEEAGSRPLPRDRNLRDFTVSLSCKEVVLAVSRKSGISTIELLSMRRHQDVMIWRHMIYGLCSELTYASKPQIGRILNNRDHTTILHGIRRLAVLRENDPAIDRAYRELRAELSES